MGAEFQVESLEEMCDLMCDNIVPTQKEREYWIFTFGGGTHYEGYYVKVYGSFSEARQKMFNKYGSQWGFQYSSKEWQSIVDDPTRFWNVEELLEVIE